MDVVNLFFAVLNVFVTLQQIAAPSAPANKCLRWHPDTYLCEQWKLQDRVMRPDTTVENVGSK